MEILQIKKLLKERRITYEQLSQMSGVPMSTIRYIFSGRTPNPRVDTMRAFENALGLTNAPPPKKPEILELYEQLDKGNQELAKAYIFGLLASEDKAYFDIVQQKMVLRSKN